MMECFKNVIIKSDIFHALSQKLLNISLRRNCKKLTGYQASRAFISVKPLETLEIIPLSDLISNMYTGRYTKELQSHQLAFGVDSPCSYPSVWKVLLYQSLLEVILFKIDRRMDKGEVLMKSPISADFEIDLQSYTAYKHEANPKYHLAAVVCHEASTKRFGHFITHLRTGADTIKTIDDDRPPKIFKLDALAF